MSDEIQKPASLPGVFGAILTAAGKIPGPDEVADINFITGEISLKKKVATYDIKQVTRYVLIRNGDTDVAEFKRRDDAEHVMGTLRAAIHPVAYEGVGTLESKPVEKDASIKVGEFAIALDGIVDNKNTLEALDLLESRVASTKRVLRHREAERQSKLQAEALRVAQEKFGAAMSDRAELEKLRLQAEANRLNGLIGRGF